MIPLFRKNKRDFTLCLSSRKMKEPFVGVPAEKSGTSERRKSAMASPGYC